MKSPFDTSPPRAVQVDFSSDPMAVPDVQQLTAWCGDRELVELVLHHGQSHRNTTAHQPLQLGTSEILAPEGGNGPFANA